MVQASEREMHPTRPDRLAPARTSRGGVVGDGELQFGFDDDLITGPNVVRVQLLRRVLHLLRALDQSHKKLNWVQKTRFVLDCTYTRKVKLII